MTVEMIISQKIQKQLRGDYRRVLISSFGCNSKDATPEQIKAALGNVWESYQILGRDNPQQFKSEFFKIFEQERKQLLK